MTRYTRRQILEILQIDGGDAFIAQLEAEEIIAPEPEPEASEPRFSEVMLERARVAHDLLNDLEVNLAGAAIIVRMREEMLRLRRELTEVLARVEREREGR